MYVCGLDWAGLGQGQLVVSCECGNEYSGSLNCGEYLVKLQNGSILKMNTAPWSK